MTKMNNVNPLQPLLYTSRIHKGDDEYDYVKYLRLDAQLPKFTSFGNIHLNYVTLVKFLHDIFPNFVLHVEIYFIYNVSLIMSHAYVMVSIT